MSQLVERMKEQGHWRVVIKPELFVRERIGSLAECERLVERYQVRHRGWYFPHTDASGLRRGLDYIELETDFPLHPEAWRFYQSAQFAFWAALGEDNLDHYPGRRLNSAEPGKWLSVLATLYRLSEIYEFTARLAQEGVYGDQFSLAIALSGLKGRQMEFGSPDRSMGMDCVCIEESLPREKTFRTADFVPKARDLALEHFLWVTERFQCAGTEHVFRRDQEKFFEGRY